MKSKTGNKFSTRAKIALIRKGLSVVEIAKELKRPRPTISSVINGSVRFPRLRELVAQHLGISA